MDVFVQQLINGLALGSLYALTAIGYSLVYAVLELINFTHGTMYMLGAYLFYVFTTLLNWNYGISFFVAILCTGIMGYLIEFCALRPLRRKNLPSFTALICTIGLSILIQNIMLILLGSETRQFPTLFEGKYIPLGKASISYLQLFVVAIALVLMVALTLFIRKSRSGMAMRATAQNTATARLMGVPVNRVVSFTFFFGAVFAAISGIFACMIFRNVNLSIGVAVGSKTFAATVLGGIGELNGAVLGGLLIGVVETLTAGYIDSSLRDIAAFVVLVIVLIFKPYGLLGKPALRKV
ncbi:branched-chain amino acid ABC transporter permease [Spirochaetia bacterium]|nr:branched-chain amino acid ABC transporter permease [Spirochaetia bacterium]